MSKNITATISLDKRWNRVPGVQVDGNQISIDIDKYFYRYESPQWKFIPWEKVQAKWSDLSETQDSSLEQNCLSFVKEAAITTNDPTAILENAEKAYSFLFDPNRIDVSGLPYVTNDHLKILKEASTLMALNRVDQDGRARNVGPAWFLPACSQKVYDLSQKESEFIDELYHGTFFTEARRVDSVKAHTALGGRLVHGCQGNVNQSGGCIVEYGTSVEKFHADLKSFRDDWMQAIHAW